MKTLWRLRASASTSVVRSALSGTSSTCASRKGSVWVYGPTRIRRSPWARMRTVPSGTRTMRCTTATVPMVVDLVGAGLGELGVAAGDQRDHPVRTVHHLVDQAHRARLADRQRRHGLREDHRLLQREHRERRRDLEVALLRRRDIADLEGDVLLGHQEVPRTVISTRRVGGDGASGRRIRRMPFS